MTVGGAVNAADLTGKITLKGTPPPEKTITMDKICGEANGGKMLTTRHYVVSGDGGLANVFVYVKEGLAGKSPAPKGFAFLDQKGCMYEPYVLGMVTNQELQIKNSDPTIHNVNAQPKKNQPFNFGQPIKDQINKKTFANPETNIRFMCNVHPWMFAFVNVLEHTHFAVTDKEGKYTIPNLPAGKYTIEVIHPKAGTTNQQVTVEDKAKPVDFTLEIKPVL